MTYGLKVVNANLNTVLGDNVIPYRYVRVRALPYQIAIGPNPYYGIHVPDLTPAAMVAIDTQGAVYKRRNFAASYPYTNPPVVRDAPQGGHHLVLQENGFLMRADYWELVKPPEIYIVDRLRPTAAATGFGINVFDDNRQPLLNSSTPLVKVLTNHTITTPAVAGSASNTLLLIHNPPPTSNMSYYQYPGAGGSTLISGGAYTDQTVVNGQHHVNYVEWEEEQGEGSVIRNRPVSLMVSLIEKPA